MKCLIVTTHPLSNSLCKLLADGVVSKLTEMGNEVVLEDLYADGFDPVLTKAERESYYKDQYDTSEISKYTKRLEEAEGLVPLFPTWWFSFPAMLKGWFDRVWGPGIAYDHASDLGKIKPCLDELRQVLVVTTLGAPWWVDRLIMRQPVKKIVKFALLGACAKKSRLTYLSLYNSEKLSMKNIEQFKGRINRALDGWS